MPPSHPDQRDGPAESVRENEPITVLYVDEQREFVDTVADVLDKRENTITVDSEISAAEGVERLNEGGIDCVVSDYQLPDTDGLEFLETVREEYADLPVILFTREGSEEVASEAISAGVTDYLQKGSGGERIPVLANRIENAVQKRRMERRLEESQRQFQTLLNTIPGMAYRSRNERGWPMQFVSDGCTTLTGYDPSELVGGDVSYGREIMHPDDRERVWNTIQDALDARDPFRVEYRIQTADSETKWVWERGRGVFEDGDVVALEGFITDVTERKTAQSRLEYQTSLLEAQMETTIDGLLVVDDSRDILSYNDRFVEMWDVPEDSIEHGSDEAPLDWVIQNKVANPEAFCDLLEELDANPERSMRDEVQLTDGRIFDRYSAPVLGDDGTTYGRLWMFRDITTQKEREAELERQEFRFRRVQEIADIGVWEYDPRSGTLDWSHGIRQIHGVSEGYEPTLEEAVEFYHPDDRDEIRTGVERAIEQGESYDRELRIVRPDGTVRDVRARGEVNTDETGEPTLVRGVFQDITERKQRERELRQFKEAVEQAAHAIYITDTDGTIEYVNPSFEEITGYTREEALGATPAILSSGEYDEGFYATLWSTVLSGEDWEHEMIDERKDGQKITLDQTIAPIETDEGEVEGFVAINRDITERKEQEERLQIYEYACNSALSGIAIANLDGELRSVNAAFCEMWGYEDREDVRGRSVTEFWSEPEAAAEVVASIRETGSWGGELKAVKQDGSTFIAYCSASYVKNESGEPIALMSSFVDITDRKDREQKLKQANEELEVLNRVIRHDIRNDMSVILGWAELLEGHVDDTGTEYLEKVLTSGEHIVELTEVARDYVEAVTSDGAVEIKPTPLQSVLETELTLRQESYPDAEITAVGSIPDVEVQANEMLSAVFRNLLNNAVQHNDKDTPVVQVRAEEHDDHVEISIVDNGPGIPESRREAIFGKGERSLESPGTGIGLYLVQMIIEQYDGAVTVDDADSGGAVFTVRLPKAN